MSKEIVYLPLTLKELSHELRTPLTGILGMAHLLESEPLTPTQKLYVDSILQAGDVLLKLANQLLDARKITTNTVVNSYSPGLFK